ncbi:putative allantoate permease protein [Neofusicoccum parvum UCRNP2]|uniref:Putative allantoate permease protein n=1 Tax=Botryosphaeria parva (strain UCR-NP2) TaxID=1287680 RepID=R1GTX5_BOTPV|nr:putative allantoate permease protein [Neofusicoccum parvum UCRNP2]
MTDEKTLQPTLRPREDFSDGDVPADEVNEKALLRKIDWRIVPILFLTYFLQFLDKVVVNYANLMGIQKDLGMKGNDFSWMATAFFIAFALAEFPQGALIQRYSVVKVLSANVFLWGVILCCSSACVNFAGILACRIALGMCEAVIGPALIMITSTWYTKAESTPRYGLWYCGLGVGQILGGFISFGAQHAPASLPFAGWRIMFVAVGASNILVAALCLTFLPSTVSSARFLTPAEKASIAARLAADRAGTGPKIFSPRGALSAFSDLQTWLLALLTLLTTTPSGVITTYSAILIKSFGYTPQHAALLNTPSGLVSIAATLLTTHAIIRGAQRTTTIALILVPTLLGAALMSFLPAGSRGGLLTGIYLVNCTVAPLALTYALVGANFAGYTKKVAAGAVVMVSFSAGNVVGPQTFQARDAPAYLPAKAAVLAVEAAGMVAVLALRALYVLRNGRADREGGPAGCAVERRAWASGMVDGFEGQDAAFRYVL